MLFVKFHIVFFGITDGPTSYKQSQQTVISNSGAAILFYFSQVKSVRLQTPGSNFFQPQGVGSSPYTIIILPAVIVNQPLFSKELFIFEIPAPRGSRLCRRATCQQ